MIRLDGLQIDYMEGLALVNYSVHTKHARIQWSLSPLTSHFTLPLNDHASMCKPRHNSPVPS